LYAFQHNILLYALGLITALTTAIYIFRAYYLTFMGRPRDPEVDAHVHESGSLILWPLWILSALTILGGVLNLPFVLTLEHALAPVVGELHPPGVQQEILLMVVSAVIAIGGARLAWSAYQRRTAWVDTIRATFKPLGKLAQQRWYVDELYDRQVLRGTHWLSHWLAFAIDQQVIDRIVNWSAETAMAWSRSLRRLNDGLVPTYAFSVFIGATVLMAYFWLAT
jgi:NADH-quinone oxidoreductase subunit L